MSPFCVCATWLRRLMVQRPILGPSSRMPEHGLGPVRKLGCLGDEGKPLLHAKLLVLGDLAINIYGPDDSYGIEELDFEPRAVWCGSANWTQRSRKHLDFGFVSDDPSLVSEVTDFVADLITFSKPVNTTCAGPEPNLVAVEFDDVAMAEALADMDDDPDDQEWW